MNYEERWEILNEIAPGGQGMVYLVRNKSKFNTGLMNLHMAIEQLMSDSDGRRQIGYQKFRNAINEITKVDNGYLGALKVLHSPKDARDSELAEERIKREIKAMADVKHPNLIEVLDVDTEEKWFVTRYYSKGTLTNNSASFTGNLPKALKAIRPLVEGVAKIHEVRDEAREKARMVHRDIKPDNIFISDEGQLILGDFGLVFFEDKEHTRISNTFENVGSTDWMPGWARGKKIDEVRPSFDVFSLGKTIWSMVSDTPFLRYWYYYEDEFNLERKFPNARHTSLANELFSMCIVEKEKDCKIENAHQLLEAIDEIIGIIEKDADVVDISERACSVCGRGKYELKVDQDDHVLGDFGLRSVGNRKFRIFVCDHCGHMLIFTGQGKVPEPWIMKKKDR